MDGIRILFEWMWTGITFVLGALRAERDWMRDNIKFADSIWIRKEDLVACIPDVIPYRTKTDIEKLLAGTGTGY
jgi:hypothetical protein